MSTEVAVVTGSNKGLGLAIVKALCKQFQGDVYLTARDVGRGQAAVEGLSSEGLKPLFLQLDVNDLNSITTAAAFFKDKYGGVDVLVNNAGIAFRGSYVPLPAIKSYETTSPEGSAVIPGVPATDTTPFAVQAEVTLKTNFFAARDVLTHFLPIIRPGGRVVNVSSLFGSSTLKQCSPDLQQRFRSDDITEDELVGLMQRFVEEAKRGEHKQGGWPEMAYGVSKTGLTVLSMILARRLSKERPNDGILLNACCPGWVRTDMTDPKASKSPDEGAITPVYLALLPAGATEPHGKFVSDKQVQPW